MKWNQYFPWMLYSFGIFVKYLHSMIHLKNNEIVLQKAKKKKKKEKRKIKYKYLLTFDFGK